MKTRKLMIFSTAFATAMFAMPALPDTVKPFQVGFGGFGVNVENGDSDNKFRGPGVNFQAALADSGRSQLALRVNYAQLEHEDFSSLSNDTGEALLLWGSNLNRTGFKWYVGGGVFQDRVQLEGFERSRNVSGGQLTGGLGYNWSNVGLDVWVSGRERSAYDTGAFRPDSVTAGGVTLGFRF
ncbi:hypothetical protein FM042_06985 [Aliidiomarina halalkaliphila]|uniref:Outer membrane protein beta-barrel domain-containing protein n=1 Tax=Aliidiomarina halalkaliphila TaxID=2593535 RepID=A0A552X0Z3_9GAMM|nr:hypothetical protein [Aliidiomarina halalkaliphila]TRW48721.1 hypothetical protein FM042_06985 [Aliidiomarina halalkaliphila]